MAILEMKVDMKQSLQARLNKINARYVVGAVLVAPFMAHAAAGDFDTSSVTTTITAVGVAVATIGAAVLVLKIGVKAWKWIASAA